MKLEDQVCSLELAKRLKEFGFKQESFYGWAIPFDNGDGTKPRIYEYGSSFNIKKWYSAYTVAELGEMLPQIIKINHKVYQLFISVGMDKQWFVVYANEKDYHDNAPMPLMLCHNEAEARAKMLIYLTEKGLIKP